MKGEITLKILEFLEEGITTISDLATAFLSAGYGASKRKLDYEFEKRHYARESQIGKLREFLREKHGLSKLVYKLKKDGLLTKTSKKLFLTTKGREKLTLLKKRESKKLHLRKHQKKKDNKLKIIIFDIPERERDKRHWLRTVLKMLDFKMLQKSVWAGRSKLPEDFLEDLRNLRLLSYIEIFEISKTGSLKQIA